MLELARGYEAEDAKGEREGGIMFRRVDVTNEEDMRGLVEEEAKGGFDVVLMNMAIMDVADLGSLARALRGGLLAPGGV